MNQSTFRGRTLEEASRAAKDALGEHATIVATRKLARRGFLPFLGGHDFEVTAEAPPKEPAPRGPKHPFTEAVRLPNAGIDPLAAIRSEVRGEIRALRAMIAQRAAEESAERAERRGAEVDMAELHELVETVRSAGDDALPGALRRMLATAGIEGQTALVVSKRTRRRGDGATLAESYRQAILETLDIGVFPLADPSRKAVIALIGPTGVGKTTTAAKLAAHAALEQKRSVTIVSTDGFRVGAREQLERFAELLGVTLRIASTRRELDVAIATSTSDVTIVDTAGRDPGARDALEAALPRTRLPEGAWPEDRHILLCMPAALRELDARRFAKTFAACNPTGIVITKVDETSAPSGLLHGPLAAKVPLVAMCFGQRVPEDIDEASHLAALAALCPPRRTASKPRGSSS